MEYVAPIDVLKVADDLRSPQESSSPATQARLLQLPLQTEIYKWVNRKKMCTVSLTILEDNTVNTYQIEHTTES